MTAAQHLTLVDAAIQGLLEALADEAVQEYTFQGRTYVRADFARTLEALYKRRDILSTQAARESSSPIRLASFGSPRGLA